MESRSQVASELEPWLRLENKVVMVTGASSGLGRDFCLDLAKAGCRVIAAARRVDRLRSLCNEINSRIGDGPSQDQPRAVALELDVSASAASIEASVQKAWAAFGRIDALINNAGIRGGKHSPLDLSEKDWDVNIKTNLTGTWLVSKYVCMRMLDGKQGGSVVNIIHCWSGARPTTWRPCLCLCQDCHQRHDQGHGFGIGAVSNTSELYISGPLQIRDNSRSNVERLAQKRRTKNRPFKNVRHIGSCTHITCPLLDP
ncbi:UNVERIFIED_CONTAM: 3-oxoacyl-[acyl-carrier-protein] reductase 1, chloroplastic [Sesamum radiatum]|uniref:3-oxoacyl-[acyl-carrier-protein] reductase 1, chloroplastic n=1 Tax=Sesamum radiatum TaxID=300843 RepID=A0AAW2LCC7_SESRA